MLKAKVAAGGGSALAPIEGRVRKLEQDEAGMNSARRGKFPGKAYDEAVAEQARRKELASAGAGIRKELVGLLASGRLDGKSGQGWELFNRIDRFVRRQEPAVSSSC